MPYDLCRWHSSTSMQQGAFVKRIQRFPDHLLIKSANPEYAPFKITTTEDNDQNIAIIGKVVWLGRKI